MKSITEKIDAITEMKEGQYSPTPPCPKSVKIELTARCNFRCAFCATAAKLRDKGDMDWDFYANKLLPDLRASGVEEVGMFYLGESTLLKWLPEAIAEAKAQGFPYVFLTTNGSSSPQMLTDCMDAGLDSLKFSLNYSDSTQFSEIANVKPALFDKMISNIKHSFMVREDNGYDCGIYASFIRYDGEQGERMADVLNEIRPYVDEYYALPLYSQADLVGVDEAERGWDIRAGNPGRADNMQQPIPCWSLFTEGRVSYDGHLSACCFDHDGRFRMGDINQMSFMDAWHSPDFQKLRASHLEKELAGTACEHCVAYS